MKSITTQYKQEIKKHGKQINSIILYTIDNTNYSLGANELNSISLHYNGDILKSVMKQLDIDSNVNIPIGTIINFKFGLKVNNAFEYIDYGYFVVYSSEKQEDLHSYKLLCYDSLVEFKKEYSSFATYPITIRSYINQLCSYLGLSFANYNDTFPNYDKILTKELYLDENGNTLNYTFMDVLDELAQVTASTICINNDNQVELRYVNNTQDSIDEENLKDVNVNFGQKYGAINTITFKRSADSDAISKSIPEDLSDDLKVEIAISDNQILNDSNRADYIDDILNQLYGLEYYSNDFVSTGITYYELCDMYNVIIDNNTYKCLMLNDEINITQGLEENVYTELPKESVTDYDTTTKDDRAKLRTELIVDKINGEINGVVESTDNLGERVSRAEATLDSQGARLDIVSTNIDPITGDVLSLKRTGYEIGADGIVTTGDDGFKSISNTQGTYYYDNERMVGKYTKDGSVQKDIALSGKYYYGIDEDVDVENFSKDDAMFVAQLYIDEEGEKCFGHFSNM